MQKDGDIEVQHAAAAQIEQNFEQTVLSNKIQSMNDELDLFSKTQDPDHFKSALQIHQELEDKNSPGL